MSASLYWEPTYRKKEILSDELKFILRDKKGLQDYMLMDKSYLPYLEGLFDSGIKDANKLIKAIEKYKEINVGLEY